MLQAKAQNFEPEKKLSVLKLPNVIIYGLYANSGSLSARAFGALCYKVCRPTFDLNKVYFKKTFNISENIFHGIVRELKSCGVFGRKQEKTIRKTGGQFSFAQDSLFLPDSEKYFLMNSMVSSIEELEAMINRFGFEKFGLLVFLRAQAPEFDLQSYTVAQRFNMKDSRARKLLGELVRNGEAYSVQLTDDKGRIKGQAYKGHLQDRHLFGREKIRKKASNFNGPPNDHYRLKNFIIRQYENSHWEYSLPDSGYNPHHFPEANDGRLSSMIEEFYDIAQEAYTNGVVDEVRVHLDDIELLSSLLDVTRNKLGESLRTPDAIDHFRILIAIVLSESHKYEFDDGQSSLSLESAYAFVLNMIENSIAKYGAQLNSWDVINLRIAGDLFGGGLSIVDWISDLKKNPHIDLLHPELLTSKGMVSLVWLTRRLQADLHETIVVIQHCLFREGMTDRLPETIETWQYFADAIKDNVR